MLIDYDEVVVMVVMIINKEAEESNIMMPFKFFLFFCPP
jgi:hypothetical protein